MDRPLNKNIDDHKLDLDKRLSKIEGWLKGLALGATGIFGLLGFLSLLLVSIYNADKTQTNYQVDRLQTEVSDMRVHIEHLDDKTSEK